MEVASLPPEAEPLPETVPLLQAADENRRLSLKLAVCALALANAAELSAGVAVAVSSGHKPPAAVHAEIRASHLPAFLEPTAPAIKPTDTQLPPPPPESLAKAHKAVAPPPQPDLAGNYRGPVLHRYHRVQPDPATNDLLPFLQREPSLDQLAALFPDKAAHYMQEKAAIAKLARDVQVSTAGYREFRLNRAYLQAFADHPSYPERIRPLQFVFHWTAESNPTVQHLVYKMMHRHDANGQLDRPSVLFFASHSSHSQVYQLAPDASHEMATTLGSNDQTQSIEMDAKDMSDVLPSEVEQAIYTAVKFLIDEGLPANQTTLISHYQQSLLEVNPNYDPWTGRTLPGFKLLKEDLPKEFMEQVVWPKAIPLYALLKAADKSGH